MTHLAIVVPADPTVPHRVIEWPYPSSGEQLVALHREIGCECVDASPLVSTPLGILTYWVDDESLLAEDVRHNDRGIALFRSFGYQVPDIAGTMVITGGVDAECDTVGLPGLTVTLLDFWLKNATDFYRERTAQWN